MIESSRTAVPADAQSVKEALAAVGFDVALQVVLPLDVYGDFVNDPTSDYALAFSSWGRDYPDAITFFNPLLDLSRRNARPGQLGQVLRRGFRFGRRHDQPAPARFLP